VPVVDFAYQGFGFGLREDADWLVAWRAPAWSSSSARASPRLRPVQRTGGRVDDRRGRSLAAGSALSHLKIAIRSNYSNPPAHGGDIVETILTDPACERSGSGPGRDAQPILGNRAAW